MQNASEKIEIYEQSETPELSIDVVTGPHSGEHWTTDKEHVSIGRSPKNDFMLGGDVHVSRCHLVLAFMNGCWTVSDSDSCNGTYLKLSSEFCKVVNRVDLYQDSVVHVGETSLSLSWVI